MTQPRRGAIILCGGKSTRMGRDKAMLPFGPNEVMLQRVVRIVSEVVEPSRIVVIAAEGQKLPRLAPEVQITRDRRPDRGPLEGLATGLAAIGDRADIVYVTSCDVPLLAPAFVERLFEFISRPTRSQAPPGSAISRSSASRATPSGNPATQSVGISRDEAEPRHECKVEIVVPRDGRFHHPLAAVYRTSVLRAIEELLAADRLRSAFLLEKCRTLEVSVDALRDVDPELHSLMNCNRPEDYETALRLAEVDPASVEPIGGD